MNDREKVYIQQKLTEIHSDLRLLTNKLDNHLERLSKAETHIDHLRGHLRLSTTIFLSIVSVLVLSYWDKLAILLLNSTQP